MCEPQVVRTGGDSGGEKVSSPEDSALRVEHRNGRKADEHKASRRGRGRQRAVVKQRVLSTRQAGVHDDINSALTSQFLNVPTVPSWL